MNRSLLAACYMLVCSSSLVVSGHLSGHTSKTAQTSNATEAADLVIVHGRVYPADGSGAFHEAMAVKRNRVLAVGNARDIDALRGPQTAVVDAAGGAVVPGFSDSHIHFLMGGETLDQASLDEARTLDDIQKTVKTFAASHPDRPWVLGWGWWYSAIPGNLPTRQQLDAAVADRPASLRCGDGHSVWVNSKALALATITRDTPDPKNGVIVRDQNGEPTGLLKESAQALIETVMPTPTAEDNRRAIAAAVTEAHRNGVTAIRIADGTPEDLELYAAMKQVGELKMRTYSALSIKPGFTEADADRFDAVWNKYPEDPTFKTGLVKLMVDGVIETNTAAMLSPYLNAATSGTPNYTQEELERIVTAMDRRGWQIMIHAIGDRGIRMALDAFERAIQVNPAPARGRRHSIEHIETIDPQDIPRFGKLGIIASMQPLHGSLMNRPGDGWMSGVWSGNLGPERAARGWMWNSIAGDGGRLAFGSDWPVVTLNPAPGIVVAINRTSRGGLPSQALSMTDVIDAYTRGAAYASFEDARRGTLAPGMLADIAVLSTDIFTTRPAKAADIVVTTTIFDGKVVYRRSGESGTGQSPAR